MFESGVPRPASCAEHGHRHLSDAAARYEATFRHAPVGIAHVAPDGQFIDVNETFAAITGHSRETLLANGFPQITHPDDLGTDLAHVDRLLSGAAERYCMEKRYLRADGTLAWVNLTVRLIRDADGAPDFFVSVIEDLSEVMRARAEALHDPLTGVLNRRGFLERMARERTRAAAGETLTLVYLDLDAFKALNDRLGHAVGDDCLVRAAAALKAELRPGDRIARMGGDEFVMLLPGLGEAAGAALVPRLRAALEGIVAAGWPIRGSFGAVAVAADDPRGDEALIALADRAMFDDKRRRRAGR